MADTWDSALADVKKLTAQQIALTAIDQNAKIMADDPRPLTVERHVDGAEGAPETAVKEGGVIVYDYGRVDVVAEYALDILRQLSPFDEGDYVRSHVVMLNGTNVGSTDSANAMQAVDLRAWKPGDRITISNTMPYTRKIEIGRKGYRAHGHVYEKAAALVNRRYGNLARVTFIYDKAPRGGGADGVRAWAWASGDHSAKHQEWLTRQPTLLIQEL